jgi:selenocysteine lyase/cysteine desulfurase
MTNSNAITAPDWNKQRARFPLLRRQCFMNSCSYGLLSDSVEAAYLEYLSDRHAHGSHWDAWIGRYEGLRGDLARLLGCGTDEVAVTGSASAGINAVASAMTFDGDRDKVVITDLEFPTNAQIWYAQEARGATLERVVAEGNASLLERLAETVDERTRIVAVTHVCYRNGEKLDVAAIARLARAKGAYVLIDGFQAVGTMPIDVSALDCDFYVGGTLKYLLASAGVAYLYARGATTAELQPTATGWFAQADIGAMDARAHHPATNARRFEGGTPPIPNVYAARAGLALIEEIGLTAIGERIKDLSALIADQARAAGIPMATPDDPERRGAMVALRSRDAPAMVAALHEENIITSSRDGNVRLSPHFYNDRDDVERVFDAIGRHRSLML